MKRVFIEHDQDERYWIIIEQDDDDNQNVAHPIMFDEIKLIRDACNKFLESK